MVNLYWVHTVDYGYFVFAESANRAKSLCVYFNSEDEEYIGFRVRLLKKRCKRTKGYSS